MKVEVEFNRTRKKLSMKEDSLISDILKKIKINREIVVVARNGKITHEKQKLQAGDKIQVIRVVSGG